MDPASAIATAIGQATSSVFDFLTASKAAKYGRLPDWLSPKDFKDQDNRTQTIIIGGVVLLAAVIIAIIISVTRKK